MKVYPTQLDIAMTQLHQQQCEACRADAPKINDDELARLIKEIPEWVAITDAGILKLQREFHFDNFVQALQFCHEVAMLAEQYGHHPALLLEWGKLTVTWWTHKIAGLHKTDFIMAAKTDQLRS